MDDDEDLPDMGEPLTRREYVIQEVEHLAPTRAYWADELAQMLDYTDAQSINAALQRWGRPDLARYFERTYYDGAVPPSMIAQQENRRKAREAA